MRPTFEQLRDEDDPGCIERERLKREAPAMKARIAELEEIVRAKSAFLQELYDAAGFKVGEQVSVPALIARLQSLPRAPGELKATQTTSGQPAQSFRRTRTSG